jgi:hypothetical protein
VDLTKDQAVVVLIIELYKTSFNAGQEGGCRSGIESNDIFTQKRNLITQFGSQKKIMLSKYKIGIGMVRIIQGIFNMAKTIELRIRLLSQKNARSRD